MISTVSRRAMLFASCATAFYAAPAYADVTLATTGETALVTSSDGNITIADEGSLEVEGSDPLVLDTDDSITIDDGGLVYADDADNRNGIRVEAGTDGTISNAGGILVIEDFVPDDDDGNSTPDGPIAEASGRTGILVQSTQGSIDNSGAIYVEGLDSAGISFADGWSGDFDNTGTIYVVGDNSIGVSTGEVLTDFSLGGAVTAIGQGAQAFSVDGDVAGSLVIDGALTKGVTYTNDDGGTYLLSRAQLREIAPAVQISGNVADGILIAAPPLDLDSDVADEDGDGIDDADETTGSITTYGESPALVIGGTDDTVIGGGTTRDGTYSLGIDGSVAASGYYSTFDATGVVIGGQGGAVDLEEGISVGGAITATTPDSNAVALLINEDSNVPELYVSGSIRAVITSQGEGSAIAVRDLSGTLSQVDNTGYITVSGASEDGTVALDLGNNTSGVVINQYLNSVDAASYADELADEDYDPDSPTVYAGITGDIITGSGDDVITASTGVISGDTYLGLGNDTVSLTGNTAYFGDIFSQAGVLDMSLSDSASFQGTLDAASLQSLVTLSDSAVFSGTTQNGENLTINVDGGLIEAADGETVTFDTLNVAADGSIGVVLDAEEGASSQFAVQTANFESGAGVVIELDSFLGAEGTYQILTADTLSGADGLELAVDGMPLIYAAELSSDANIVAVSVDRKTAAELGLNVPQSAAFEAVLQTAEESSALQTSILQVVDVDALGSQIEQLIPEYQGGVFDFVTRSSRLANRRLTDGIAHFDEWPVGVWLEPFWLNGGASADETPGYDLSGWGLTGGWERRLGDAYLGVSGSWATGSTDTEDYRSVDISKYEIGAHGRVRSGNFYGFARAGYFRTTMDLSSTFTGTIDDTDFTYESAGDWSGSGFTATLGGSYDLALTRNFTLRPKVSFDYFQLDESGYETAADIDALALTVSSRTSDAASVNPSLVASYTLGSGKADENPLTLEFEGGYRSILSGQIGSLTATFEESDIFTLLPSGIDGGWNAEARIKGGAWDHAWQIGIGAEQTSGEVGITARAGLNVAF